MSPVKTFNALNHITSRSLPHFKRGNKQTLLTLARYFSQRSVVTDFPSFLSSFTWRSTRGLGTKNTAWLWNQHRVFLYFHFRHGANKHSLHSKSFELHSKVSCFFQLVLNHYNKLLQTRMWGGNKSKFSLIYFLRDNRQFQTWYGYTKCKRSSKLFF